MSYTIVDLIRQEHIIELKKDEIEQLDNRITAFKSITFINLLLL